MRRRTASNTGRSVVNSSSSKRVRSTEVVPRAPRFGVPRLAKPYPTGVPPQLRVVHRYSDTLTFTHGGSAAAAYKQYVANGMYDPDVSAGGHQPMYFDELAALYRHYMVTSSKVTVEFSTAANSVPHVIGVCLDDDQTLAGTSMESLSERPSSTTLELAPGTTRKITKYFSLKRNFGNVSLGVNTFQGSPSTNPTEQMVFVLFSRPVLFTDTPTIYIKVSIEYNAVWTEIFEPSTS